MNISAHFICLVMNYHIFLNNYYQKYEVIIKENKKEDDLKFITLISTNSSYL